MNTRNIILPLTLFMISTLTPASSLADQYARHVSMTEEVVISSISGHAGTVRNLGKLKNDDALAGIASYERQDAPCNVSILTESVNDSEDDQWSDYKDLCGGKTGSSRLQAKYADTGVNSKRVFVTGIRVCLNDRGKRVKGFQLYGKRISDDGRLLDIGTEEQAEHERRENMLWVYGVISDNAYTYPVANRTNCNSDVWEPWAHCPSPRQLAVGVQLHFAAGDPPRSLSGIALKCRYLSRITSPVD